MAWTAAKCYMLIMVVANIVFLAAGGFVLYAGIYLKTEHWADMFEGDTLSKAQGLNETVSWSVLIFASLIIVAATIGFFGAVFRVRFLLVIYAILCALSAIAFLAISGGGWFVFAKASSWKDKTYPADEKQERAFANRFNQVYCYATGANLCNNVAFSDAISTLAPNATEDVLSLVLHALKDILTEAGIVGMQSLCANYRQNGPVADLASLVPSFKLDPVCTGCETANQFSNLNSVFAWANAECAPDPAALKWCVGMLSAKTQGPDAEAPFRICRSKVYGALTKWTPIVVIPLSFVTIALFFLVFVACVVHRRGPQTSKNPLDQYKRDIIPPTAKNNPRGGLPVMPNPEARLKPLHATPGAPHMC
ncbi:hypothetical protein DYB32_003519 [Aphanomyces invadans]|uniref:Tetraspanin n=1 Tax=Aphanomyces invadans TaxID=157072 RepID=A0A3R6VZH4_9STRA|nr:hypothetical protein DYB32_003519 [Aphanomyces invadans]